MKRLGRRRAGDHARLGCGFVMLQGLMIASLLFINGLLVRAFILANHSVEDARISQTVQFAIPLLMIFAELWLFDYLTSKTSDE